ncbi:acetylornithine deacetylase [Halogranum amylolyticum]|uniref:Acetylornithine deacetylase n=1 Tax=Halogranum amylolyticum TaxID=660520 RepID=A0A1H8P8M7_9EURY|nr:M20 family metallopeptidase [Halogranum amylolyticum]SEO37883.1 acetylornithine deacetylase [Halogranum amylolyticum]
MSFDPVDFLDAAVRIESHDDVSAMREFLVETLANHGVEATVDDAGNTVASKGTGSPHVVLNTHVDTVTPHVPYERDDEAGVVRGRGSCDAKGPLAALLSGFLAVDPGESGTLTLAVTPDEEVLSTGAAALDLDGDCYVVGEPTGLDVCNAAKGRFQGTVTLSGVSAHAAEPDSGANAVFALEQVLGVLRTFDDDREVHPSLGAATLTPTTVDGGSATNQIPADCRLVVDRRTIPPETAEGFRESLAARLRAAVPDDVDVAFELTERPTPFLEAFATDPDHPLVETLAAAANDASGGSGGAVRPFTAATEASYFAPAPTVVFGPGDLADDEGAVAHSEREYVRIEEVRTAAAAVETTLRELLAPEKA